MGWSSRSLRHSSVRNKVEQPKAATRFCGKDGGAAEDCDTVFGEIGWSSRRLRNNSMRKRVEQPKGATPFCLK